MGAQNLPQDPCMFVTQIGNYGFSSHMQGADIIIFPEYGAFGIGFETRNSIYPFLEEIPNPDNFNWNPCLDAENITEVLAQFFPELHGD